MTKWGWFWFAAFMLYAVVTVAFTWDVAHRTPVEVPDDWRR